MSAYLDFLASKKPRPVATGLPKVPALNSSLFDFQAACVDFALRQGRAGLYLDTGLGKTFCQLEWLDKAKHEGNGYALLLTPLAVARQIEREAHARGYDARVIREQADAKPGINICNYDRLDKIEPDAFGVVSLDEASILKNFSGDIIRIHEDAGWIMHSRRTIWKCPVVEMTRTKHVGLLYKQLQKDSAKSRGGMPDYLLTFVKPGENAAPINHTPENFPLDQWQEWASPVWMSVNQTRVLNVQAARSANDERHLCPLQLDVIERALVMWSNPGDVVLSPFMGIGSEGYMSLKGKRRFVGTELKPQYFQQAVRNLADVEAQSATLFDAMVA